MNVGAHALVRPATLSEAKGSVGFAPPDSRGGYPYTGTDTTNCPKTDP